MTRCFGIAFWSLLLVSSAQAQTPARVLDLSRWMLALPVDTDHPGHPDEIKQPELDTYVHPKWFFVNRDSDSVVFRAHCGGDTTKGSRYPRCELRERTSDGRKGAAWTTDSRTKHTMTMKVAVSNTPPVKPHVVCAQIHDAEDDLMMVRLERTKLFVERNELDDVSLDKHYELGTPFELKIQAHGGHVKVWYNANLKMDWEVIRDGCYFKAGCYTQSNTSKGDLPESFGEVVIYQLRVSHQ